MMWSNTIWGWFVTWEICPGVEARALLVGVDSVKNGEGYVPVYSIEKVIVK